MLRPRISQKRSARTAVCGRGLREVMTLPKGKTLNDVNANSKKVMSDSCKTIKKLAAQAGVEIDGVDMHNYVTTKNVEIMGQLRTGKYQLDKDPELIKDYWSYSLYYYVYGTYDEICAYHELIFEMVTCPTSGFPGVENFYYDWTDMSGDWVNLETGEIMNEFDAAAEPVDVPFEKLFRMVAIGDTHLGYMGTDNTEEVYKSESNAKKQAEAARKAFNPKLKSTLKSSGLPIQSRLGGTTFLNKAGGEYNAESFIYVYPVEPMDIQDAFSYLNSALPNTYEGCNVDVEIIKDKRNIRKAEKGKSTEIPNVPFIRVSLLADVEEPDPYYRNNYRGN